MMPGDEVILKLTVAEVNMMLALLDSAVRALVTKVMTQAGEQERTAALANGPDPAEGQSVMED